MVDETPEPPNIRVFSPENEAEAQRTVQAADNGGQAAADAHALVEQMAAAGRWPAPELLEQIVSAGDAAVEPLVAILRTDPRGWPEKALIVHATRLLSELRPPAAIPELVSIIRRYNNKPEEEAADALARYGTTGFEALLDLCRDPSINGYRGVDVAFAAKVAAGDDPLLRARLADVLRPRVEQLIPTAREEKRETLDQMAEAKELVDEEPDNLIDGDEEDVLDEDLLDEEEEFEDDWDDEDEFDDDWGDDPDLEDIEDVGEADDLEEHESEPKPDAYEELGFYISDLADLADPAAVELIKTAFEEELVDDTLLDQEEVDELYRDGGWTRRPKTNWLETYRKSYDRHLEALDPAALPPPIRVPRPKYRYKDRYEEGEPPSDIPATAPIRNTGPRLGRNDPCWCGSGKKYKKCHLGKDRPE